MSELLLLIAWGACGYAAFGFMLADQQWGGYIYQSYKNRAEDFGSAWLVGILGPVGLLVVFVGGAYTQGWRTDYVPASTCLADFKRRFSSLCTPDDDDFVRLTAAVARDNESSSKDTVNG